MSVLNVVLHICMIPKQDHPYIVFTVIIQTIVGKTSKHVGQGALWDNGAQDFAAHFFVLCFLPNKPQGSG